MTDAIDNDFSMKCLHCGASDQIDVAATVWVRLCVDGLETAECGDTEWTDHSSAKCCSCGFTGCVKDFDTDRGKP